MPSARRYRVQSGNPQLSGLTLSEVNRISTMNVELVMQPHADIRSPITGEDAQLARLAKALGHPARVAIMRLLVNREGCIVGDLTREIPLAQSTISQHLKQLKEAGLIRGEIDGPRVCYCVEPGAVARLKALVQAL